MNAAYPAYSREEMRAGLLAALSAYLIWGLLPVYLKLVGFAQPSEILGQRILWCAPSALVGVFLVSGLRGGLQDLRGALRPRLIGALTLSAVFIFCNWGIYVWSVANDRVLDAALAYFLAPLVQVAIGVAFDKERLSLAQWGALVFAAAGVVVQGVALGAPPWISLALCATWCAYSVMRKRVAVPAATGLLIETLILIPAAAAILFWVDAQGGATFADTPGNALLLMLAGPATAIPLALFAFGARRLRFSTIGLLQYIAPSIQFLVGLAYGESLNSLRILSFALIWAGLALFSYDVWRRESATPAR
jgi:chloramphenicol-sensitive protein RarD